MEIFIAFAFAQNLKNSMFLSLSLCVSFWLSLTHTYRDNKKEEEEYQKLELLFGFNKMKIYSILYKKYTLRL